MNSLLFQDFGVYVLFGSKPMAVTAILNNEEAEEYQNQIWAALSEDEKKEYEKELEKEKKKGSLIENLEHDPYQCWKTFQKILKELHVKKFVFGLWPVEDTLSQYQLYIADIQKTALVIEKNYDVFRTIIGEKLIY